MATLLLKRLRSLRDLRAVFIDAAERASRSSELINVEIAEALLRPERISAEWDRLLPLLDPALRDLLRLRVVPRSAAHDPVSPARTNYTYELLRLLVIAALDPSTPAYRLKPTQVDLMRALGASRTPVRAALQRLRDADIIDSLRAPRVETLRLRFDMLGRIGAKPTLLGFRFGRGAQIKPPNALLARARYLLGDDAPPEWSDIALSGIAVAYQDTDAIDLIGLPRLDLLAQVGPDGNGFDAELVRRLDDGLEPEPNPLAPAPVVVTVVRAAQRIVREIDDLRCAHPGDVFLSILELGLREDAIAYAKAMVARRSSAAIR